MSDPQLTVLYDAGCELCVRARNWLRRQPQWVPLEFVAAGSPVARERFPELETGRTLDELHVVDEYGNVYRGEKAWVVCLWALADYREWSLRIAQPGKIEQARRFVNWVAGRRHRFWRRHAG